MMKMRCSIPTMKDQMRWSYQGLHSCFRQTVSQPSRTVSYSKKGIPGSSPIAILALPLAYILGGIIKQFETLARL